MQQAEGPVITPAISIPSDTLKIPPRLREVEKKGSGRFVFIKTQQEEQQQEKQNNRDRIKRELKGRLNIVINKPLYNPQQDEIQEKLMELGKKLDIELTPFDAENIIPSTKGFYEEYEIHERLGEGCLGLVKRVVHKQTGIEYAIKIVATQDDEIIRNMIVEFKSLIKVQHENIVKVYKLYIDFNNGFQSESKAFVLMELIVGKEMFEVINELGHYCENDAKELFQQLLSAIEYMHRHGICHRDLKPHNILCVKDKKEIKVTDFNVSKFSDSYKEFGDLKDLERIEMWTYTGTVAFSAPEIFSGEGYNQMVDMWSAGCILYSMLSGQLPFTADQYYIEQVDSLNDLVDKIKEAQYEFPSDLFESVSGEAIDLIRSLLQKDWNDRLHPDQALKHAWFEQEPTFMRRTSLRKMTLKENISHFSFRNSNKQRQRTILLGSQSQISHNSSDVNHNKDEGEPQFFDSAASIRISTDVKKYDTKNKSQFAQRSMDRDLCESVYEPSPLENSENSPQDNGNYTVQDDLQKMIVFGQKLALSQGMANEEKPSN